MIRQPAALPNCHCWPSELSWSPAPLLSLGTSAVDPTEEEVLAQVAAHAKAVHNLETVSEEVVEKVRHVMRDE